MNRLFLAGCFAALCLTATPAASTSLLSRDLSSVEVFNHGQIANHIASHAYMQEGDKPYVVTYKPTAGDVTCTAEGFTYKLRNENGEAVPKTVKDEEGKEKTIYEQNVKVTFASGLSTTIMSQYEEELDEINPKTGKKKTKAKDSGNTKDVWPIICRQKKFEQWAQNWATVRKTGETGLTLNSVTIQSYDFFGRVEGKENLGFVKFVADVDRNKGNKVPGIVFLRGGAVSILMQLVPKETPNDPSTYKAVVTSQARAPIGVADYREIPAGMIDGKTGDPTGVAVDEVSEEVQIHIRKEHLIDMTEMAFKDIYPNDPGFVPSAGGSDEKIRVYFYRVRVPQAKIDELIGKQTGNLEEHEDIRLVVVPFNDLWKTTTDAKALVALQLYHNLKESADFTEAVARATELATEDRLKITGALASDKTRQAKDMLGLDVILGKQLRKVERPADYDAREAAEREMAQDVQTMLTTLPQEDSWRPAEVKKDAKCLAAYEKAWDSTLYASCLHIHNNGIYDIKHASAQIAAEHGKAINLSTTNCGIHQKVLAFVNKYKDQLPANGFAHNCVDGHIALQRAFL